MIRELSKKLREKQNKKKKGFTLIELIIVMGIMVILAAVAVPQFAAYRTKANESSDVAAAKTIHTAVNGLIADGSIKPSTNDTTVNLGNSDDTATKIKTMIDGSNVKGSTGTAFSVTIAPDGKVTVLLGDKQKYPQVEATTSGTTGGTTKE